MKISKKWEFCSETVGKCCGQSWPAAPALLGLLSPALVLPTWVEIWLKRRQLTVMFCDLVGSTALSARLDPEDLRDIIGVYHRRCAEEIDKFHGFLAKYLGDGVLAYFGYPHAGENDAEWAVRAGLALVDALGKLQFGGVCFAGPHRDCDRPGGGG